MSNRVMVELSVYNKGNQPWTAEGVEGTELVSAEGERLRVLRVRQPTPFFREARAGSWWKRKRRKLNPGAPSS